MSRALVLLALLTVLPLTGQAATCWEVVSSLQRLCDPAGSVCAPHLLPTLVPSPASPEECDTAAYTNPTGTGVGHVVLPSGTDWKNLYGLGSMDLTALGITPSNILYVYTWGLGAVLFIFGFGLAVGAAISAIRKT